MAVRFCVAVNAPLGDDLVVAFAAASMIAAATSFGFLSGTLPVVNGKLAIAGRLGANLSVKEGQEAACIASLNALAAAKQHLGGLDRLKKLVKLTVLIATTEQFADHAAVADGASDLFVQIFGRDTGHVRLVYGVQSLPIGAPVIVDTVFEIEVPPYLISKPQH